MREEKLDIPVWGLAAFSWLFAIYFMIAYHCQTGFPPAAPKNAWDATHLLVSLFFVFLPFFKKIKIGKILELERELERAQTDLKDFKETTANTLAVISTSINTVSNSNTVNVTLPSLDQMHAAKQHLENATGPNGPVEILGATGPIRQNQVDEVSCEIMSQDDDSTLALARLRINMESDLRRLMHSSMGVARAEDSRNLSLGRLFQLFLQQKPEYREIEQPFQYVNQICNAAVHAQHISDGQAKEALQMGARLLALFRKVADETSGQPAAFSP